MWSSEGGGLSPVARVCDKMLASIAPRFPDAPAFHSPPHHMSLTTVAFSPHAGKELCAACSVQNTYAHQVLNGWCFICICEIIIQFEHEQRRQWRTASARSLLLPGGYQIPLAQRCLQQVSRWAAAASFFVLPVPGYLWISLNDFSVHIQIP
jgi:hypothetical protein